ncbi:MAG: sulfatase-like hydrolase/transferase [Candidatus Sumerlaeota bacterium]|nr:sulfatase-like hydrolase/transferase [Candidatus Sumerlaeota bacterium]
MAQRQPNILFLLTDEQRYDCFGAFGNRQILTPRIDSLAGDGVLFSHAFVPYALCTPSRYSMLTGLYVHQHRGRTNKSTPSPWLETFPHLMTVNGYRTTAVGKMHFNPTYLDVGYKRMKLAEQAGEGRMDDDYHRELHAHGLIDVIDLLDQRKEFRSRAPQSYWDHFGAEISNLPEEWHSTTWIGDRAVRELEQWTNCGNLLTVSFVKPHHPFDPSKRWAGMYDPATIDILPGWTGAVPERDLAYHAGFFPHVKLTEDAIKRVTAYYYATISQIDHQIGRMIETLRQKGLYDNTMIVFTSDHGDYMGFHHMLLKQNYYYDPVARVPLIIKFPGNADAGTTRDMLTNNVDLAPTFLRQAGIEPPKEMIGLDLADPHAQRDYIFSEYGHGDLYMARSRRYKLMLCRDAKQSLFIDLEKDPMELHNLIDDPAYRNIIQEHRDALARWMLFDAIVPVYAPDTAPSVRRVTHSTIGLETGDYRQRLAAYFEREMAPYLTGP